MCLVTKQSDWLIAEKDIKCYKMLDTNMGGDFVTPYERTLVDDSIIRGERLFTARKASLYETFFPRYNGTYDIDEGAIHCYRNWLRGFINALGSYHLFKCVIPKGTRYAIGEDGEICAQAIKFVKQIYTYE